MENKPKHLSLRHLSAPEPLWHTPDYENDTRDASTYRLGEFRATRVFGKHHIDSTVRECHAKPKEMSVLGSRLANFKQQTSPISSLKSEEVHVEL